MWIIAGTIPDPDFSLLVPEGPAPRSASLSEAGLHLPDGRTVPVERGTAALAATALQTCAALGCTRKVLDAIDSPNLQIIFDPVNLLCVDNIDRQDEIINQAFELLGDEIAVVHCKDYVVEGNELKSIAAGTGSLNYPLLLKKIKEHKPYVHCTLENTVPENAAATKEFMEKTYASV